MIIAIEEWEKCNSSLKVNRWKDPKLLPIKKAFKEKPKMWRKQFTEGEINKICYDLMPKENPFCTINNNTMHINDRGTQLASFTGYIEELQKHRQRGRDLLISLFLSTAFVSVVLFVFGVGAGIIHQGYHLITSIF